MATKIDEQIARVDKWTLNFRPERQGRAVRLLATFETDQGDEQRNEQQTDVNEENLPQLGVILEDERTENVTENDADVQRRFDDRDRRTK